jgi:hypothetical protein
VILTAAAVLSSKEMEIVCAPTLCCKQKTYLSNAVKRRKT